MSKERHHLLPVAVLIFILAMPGTLLVTAQEFVSTSGLEPDVLEPDALEPDVLEPDVLEPDALGLEPVLLEDLDLPNMHEDPVPLVFCHLCLIWVDPYQHHGHRAWNPPRNRCSRCHWWYREPPKHPEPPGMNENPLKGSTKALQLRDQSGHRAEAGTKRGGQQRKGGAK